MMQSMVSLFTILSSICVSFSLHCHITLLSDAIVTRKLTQSIDVTISGEESEICFSNLLLGVGLRVVGNYTRLIGKIRQSWK